MSRLRRVDLEHRDHRHVALYGDFEPAPPGYEPPSCEDGAYERRWNPLRREWVLVAAARQGRTFLPQRSHCPLCPSRPSHSTEIPAASFEVAVFDNRFPAMRRGARSSGVAEAVASAGASEVVVYTDRHDGAFASLSEARVAMLAEVWADRYRALAARGDVRYVYIFENRGEAVGVTLSHPHGQIYGYPFIPPVARLELGSRSGSSCGFCEVIAAERSRRLRVLLTRGGVIAYVPAFARWPYEVHVAPLRHHGALVDLTPQSRRAFARALQRVARGLDRLFQETMPYMMVLHQRPTDGRPHPQAHLHAEFYPLLRDRGRLKYLAGSESGAGVFINDTLPEASAARLRAVLE
ncbi:MAG TPA: galactose-1-phosphate uridylyltransferase [Candidatus Limnocylindrales bacterium]|nr:galactose-1-phosphate uridylyltransferase [Candidatus Limnocylindrales bacterium]